MAEAGYAMKDADLTLNDTWILYFHYAVHDRNCYDSSIEAVAYVNDCCEFGYMCNALTPSDLSNFVVSRQGAHITGFSFFRNGIAPCWEHPDNAAGFDVCLREATSDDAFDKCWHALMAIAMGETLNDCLGVRVVSKASAHRVTRKLEAWMSANAGPEATLAFVKEQVADTDTWIVEQHTSQEHSTNHTRPAPRDRRTWARNPRRSGSNRD
mgnify:CR=1 FL=1